MHVSIVACAVQDIKNGALGVVTRFDPIYFC